jgi:ribosomal protein L7/L12
MVTYSYKKGDTVEFPEAGTLRIGKFIEHIKVVGVSYAVVRYRSINYRVNMDYLKPHGKNMDRNNPNRAFKVRKITKHFRPLSEQDAVLNGEMIHRIKEIRMVTGVSLQEAREAIEEAEWDTQVAIERIKFRQAGQQAGIADISEDLWEDLSEFLDDVDDV